MDKLSYLVMSGAKESMLAQAMVANNLANAKTTGFRADFTRIKSLPVLGDGLSSRAFALAQQPGYRFSEGPQITTDESLDAAIQGQGWFVVQRADGTEAYTRNGNFNISQSGLLETSNGQPLVGDSGPLILPPVETVLIGEDGTVSARPLGSPANAIQVIGRLKLVNPDYQNLEKGTDGLFQTRDGNPAEVDASVTLASGVLEGSNVNTVEELTKMIDLSRRFDVQIKMLSTAKENDQALDKLMRA